MIPIHIGGKHLSVFIILDFFPIYNFHLRLGLLPHRLSHLLLLIQYLVGHVSSELFETKNIS